MMVSVVLTVGGLLFVLGCESAPVVNPSSPIEPIQAATLGVLQDIRRLTPEKETVGAEPASEAAAGSSQTTSETSGTTVSRLKRAGGKSGDHLEPQETAGYHSPAGYQSAVTDSDYGYDSGKNSYGKQASDWSLYDQGKLMYSLS